MVKRFWALMGLVSLFAGSASAQFTFSHDYTVQVRPNSVAVGGFKTSGDIHADLAVANYLSGSVTVLLNKRNGTGTFNTGTNYPVGTHPREVAVGDFNGDGFTDIAAVDVGGNVSILINKANGTGTFKSATSVARWFYALQSRRWRLQ